jgi:hypothetical protein
MNRAKLLAAGLAAGLGVAGGCLPQMTDKTSTRGQVADDAAEADPNATIGQKSVIGNVEPIEIRGVGLVHDLHGTGSSPPHNGWRAQLEQVLKKAKLNPHEVLDDPARRTSLVLVTAVIPPGARQGDKLDVAIALPPGSHTTSLKHGTLYPCDLRNQELAAEARNALTRAGVPVGKSPVASGGTVLPGHRLAVAAGTIIAGFDGATQPTTEGDAPDASLDGPRAGRIWSGATCDISRPYYFILNENTPQPRLAMVIAERLNATFHAQGDQLKKLAEARVQSKPLVVSSVPPAYRLNHGRFLLVARQVPLNVVTPDSPYRKQLENELLRPETAIVSAIKLEALGNDSRQPLRVGLQSDSPWVRFASAEALAYLGHADGAKDLGELAEKHPSLRTHCLLALASLDDAVCLDQQAELINRPDPALRYGAFVALRSADPNHEAVRGSRVNGSFWLHQVAPDAAPMIHVSTDHRSEIALFGSVSPVRGAFSFPLGNDFTVAAKAGETSVTVTRIATKNGEAVSIPKKCRADVAAVLRTLAELGGTFNEATEFIRRAEKAQVLVAAVHYNDSPRGLPVQHLAQIARSDPSLERADLEVERAGQVDVRPAGYNLPTEADAVQAKPVAEEPALNRDPGRLFGPRRNGEPDTGPALNRSPGSVFDALKK